MWLRGRCTCCQYDDEEEEVFHGLYRSGYRELLVPDVGVNCEISRKSQKLTFAFATRHRGQKKAALGCNAQTLSAKRPA
jgi:hypothetical protein